MKSVLKKLLSKKTALPSDDTAAAMLGRHFESIRTTALEIRSFKEKITFPTPTQEVRREIDLDIVWPSSRELFIQIFGVLNGIAYRFDLEPGSFIKGCGFEKALTAFIETIERITLGLADALGTGKFTQKQVCSIDEQILLVQSGINRLRKHVIEDFNYQRAPVRAPVPENRDEAPEKITPPPSNTIISALF